MSRVGACAAHSACAASLKLVTAGRSASSGLHIPLANQRKRPDAEHEVRGIVARQNTEVTAMNEDTNPTKAIRNAGAALTLTLAGLAATAHPSAAQAQVTSPAITGVMVIVGVKEGITRERVMAVMPAEIRQTVQLYLEGRIREWYSRGDGRGVILVLDTKDVAEARAIMEGLPLARQNLVDDQYIPVGPLQPLRFLSANP